MSDDKQTGVTVYRDGRHEVATSDGDARPTVSAAIVHATKEGKKAWDAMERAFSAFSLLLVSTPPSGSGEISAIRDHVAAVDILTKTMKEHLQGSLFVAKIVAAVGIATAGTGQIYRMPVVSLVGAVVLFGGTVMGVHSQRRLARLADIAAVVETVRKAVWDFGLRDTADTATRDRFDAVAERERVEVLVKEAHQVMAGYAAEAEKMKAALAAQNEKVAQLELENATLKKERDR